MAPFDRGSRLKPRSRPMGGGSHTHQLRLPSYSHHPNAACTCSRFQRLEQYQAPKTRLDYHPAWSRNGKELFYVANSSSPFVTVPVLRTQPEIAFGSPVPMQQVPIPNVFSGGLRGYDILPDGRFVTLVPGSDNPKATDALSSELRVVEHWFEELKRLVPTK